MSERRLGPIVRLQIQSARIKHRGIGYGPGPILSVDEMAIGPLGVLGAAGDGWQVDVHHGAHPASSAGGRRALSIGFTGHYARMAKRFGAAPLGIAGENIIVAVDERVLLDDLGGTLIVGTAAGELPLRGARVAAPCAEFTSFMLGLAEVAPKWDLADDVAFLDDGMRGFILAVDHLGGAHRVRVGDEVWVRGDREPGSAE